MPTAAIYCLAWSRDHGTRERWTRRWRESAPCSARTSLHCETVSYRRQHPLDGADLFRGGIRLGDQVGSQELGKSFGESREMARSLLASEAFQPYPSPTTACRPLPLNCVGPFPSPPHRTVREVFPH